MEASNPTLSFMIVLAFLLLTLIVPILIFTLSQKILAYPFSIKNKGTKRMLWSGTLSFSTSFAIPVGLSVFPIVGTVAGLILVLPIGAYLQKSVHDLEYWPAFFFNLSSYFLYLILWVLLIWATVASFGGLVSVTSLVDQHVDLQSIVQKFMDLFQSNGPSK